MLALLIEHKVKADKLFGLVHHADVFSHILLFQVRLVFVRVYQLSQFL